MSSHDDHNQNGLDSNASSPSQPSRLTRKRRSRAKRRSEWEEEQFRTNAPYARYISEIASHYPTLTPQEVRVCACVKLMMTSWQIAEKLSVTEKSIENLRNRARKKLRLRPTEQLHSHLSTE